MRYEEVKGLAPTVFKRLTGVKLQVFSNMLGVLQKLRGRRRKRDAAANSA